MAVLFYGSSGFLVGNLMPFPSFYDGMTQPLSYSFFVFMAASVL